MKALGIAILLGYSGCIVAGSIASAETIFESTPTKTRLLELFTSEGCSSCPPAEAWLSKLKNDPRLWRDFVPLAFHVDYWDRLGWRDPYAAKEWTARQYQYSARWNSGSVYTPGFVLDGREWRNTAAPAASSDTPGVLRISIGDDENVNASFAPAGEPRPFALHVARLGFGLVTNVKAGENSGRKLEHDFVVLSLAGEKMNDGQARLRLAPPAQTAPANTRSAVVAWITQPGSLEAVQAVGGWLP